MSRRSELISSLELRGITPELRAAWRFFLEHAGRDAGAAALELARAEHEASRRGWTISEEEDHESSSESGARHWTILLRSESGEILGALGGIDTSRWTPAGAEYWRVLAAELALEALAEWRPDLEAPTHLLAAFEASPAGAGARLEVRRAYRVEDGSPALELIGEHGSVLARRLELGGELELLQPERISRALALEILLRAETITSELLELAESLAAHELRLALEAEPEPDSSS